MRWRLITCDEGVEESVEIVELLSGVGPNIEAGWKWSEDVVEILSALIYSLRWW